MKGQDWNQEQPTGFQLACYKKNKGTRERLGVRDPRATRVKSKIRRAAKGSAGRKSGDPRFRVGARRLTLLEGALSNVFDGANSRAAESSGPVTIGRTLKRGTRRKGSKKRLSQRPNLPPGESNMGGEGRVGAQAKAESLRRK